MDRNFLKETALFADLTETELVEVFMIGSLKAFTADQVIFHEGDPGNKLYLIVNGGVRISKFQNDTEEALAVLNERSFFGEMTLFDNANRSAHAIANCDCSVFVLPTKDLIGLFEKNKSIGYKFLWAFGKTLAERLRSTNEKFQVMMCLANSGF